MAAVDALAVDRRSTRFEFTAGRVLVIVWLSISLAWSVPLFYFDRWTPWYALAVAAIPLGCTALGGLLRHGDRAAIAGVGFLSWAVVTALMSSSPWLSLRGATGRDYSVIVLLGMLSTWAIGRRLSPATRDVVGPTAVVLLTIGSVIGTLQVLGTLTTGLLASFPGRAAGFSTNPVFYGSLMAGVSGYGAVRSLAARHIDRWVAAVALGGYGVVISGSRVATVSSIVVVTASIVLAARDGSTLRRVAATAGSFLSGSTIGFAVSRLAEGRSAVGRLDAGTAGRFQLWRYGLEALPERPLTGTGLGLFRDAVQSRFTTEFVRNHTDGGSQPWGDPHNLILLVAVSTGLIGVLLLVAFGVLAMRRTERSLLVLFIGIAMTWTLQPTPLVTAPFAMLVLGAGSRNRFEAAGAVSSAMLRSVPMYLGLVLATYVAAADAVLYRAATSPNATGMAAAQTLFVGDVSVETVAARRLIELRGQLPDAEARALDAARRMTELEPTRPSRWVERAQIERAAGRSEAARSSLDRALELEPTSVAAWFELSLWAKESGNDALYRTALERACALTAGCEP